MIVDVLFKNLSTNPLLLCVYLYAIVVPHLPFPPPQPQHLLLLHHRRYSASDTNADVQQQSSASFSDDWDHRQTQPRAPSSPTLSPRQVLLHTFLDTTIQCGRWIRSFKCPGVEGATGDESALRFGFLWTYFGLIVFVLFVSISKEAFHVFARYQPDTI